MIIDKVRDYVVSAEQADNIEKKIKKAKSNILMDNNLMIRAVYKVQSENGGSNWLRVRLGDTRGDGDAYASLTYKNMLHFTDRPNLEKSIEVAIGDYEGMIELLDASGFVRQSTQETLRKKYVMIDNDSEIQFEICIDTWPRLEDKFIQLKPERIISQDDWESIESFLDLKNQKAQSDSVNQAYLKKYNKSSLDIHYIGFQRFIFDRKIKLSHNDLAINKIYHSLFLYITEKCQLNCRHCFMGERLSNKQEMSKEYALTVAKVFKNLGAKNITIIGGEPTLHNSFIEIVQGIIAMQFDKVIIDTNGLSIDKILQLDPRDIDHIKVSVDSADKVFHEYIRKDNSYQKTIDNIKKLVQKGFRVCINCTLFSKNIDRILDMRELCCSTGATMLNFHIFSPIGNGYNIKELVPTPEQCNKAYKEIASHTSPIVTRFPQTWIDKNKQTELKEKGYNGCIGLGLERFSVFPDGSAYICTIASPEEKPYMHIKKDGSVDILENNEYRRFVNSTEKNGKYKCPLEEYNSEFVPICKCWKQILV